MLFRSATSAANAPDPKDKLPEYCLYEQALSDQYAGNFEAAIAIFRKVVAQDPHNTLARYSLGDSYLRARHPDEAIREWTATLQFDPEYAPADEAIGAVWMAREQWAKARPYFLQALAVAPQDGTALLQLGIAEARLSMWQQSVDHLTAACNQLPDSTQCQQELTNAKKAGH